LPDQNEWEARAANLLKSGLKRKGVTYAQLADLIDEKELNIRNKLSRGKLSAAFLLASLEAVGVEALSLR
jgi:hypothetical protein